MTSLGPANGTGMTDVTGGTRWERSAVRKPGDFLADPDHFRGFDPDGPPRVETSGTVMMGDVDLPVAFAHETLPQRVRFAAGGAADAVAEEVARLSAGRVMAIASDAARAEPVLSRVGVVVLHTDVVMHVPVDVAERARAVAHAHDVDVVVSVGGGSTTGLAKAVALTTGLPIVAVPTTYAGSEATDVWGLTDEGRKTTGVDRRGGAAGGRPPAGPAGGA